MNCNVTKKLLHLYLDKGLAPSDTRAMEDHMARCKECRAEFVRLEHLFLGVEGLPRLAAPHGIHTQTMLRVLAVHRTRERKVGLWQQAASSVWTALSLVGLVLALLNAAEFLGSLGDMELDFSVDPVGTLLNLSASVELSLIIASTLVLVAGTGALLHLLSQHRAMQSA